MYWLFESSATFGCRSPGRTKTFILLLILVSAYSRADEFDTLRVYWQNYLITNGGSPSSVAGTANSYWNSMDTKSSRTFLWSDLPFGSVSANITTTYDRLQAMALAWAMPGSSFQGNPSLAGIVAGGLDWMNSNVYTTNAPVKAQ
jgi:hyaluronate lyase